MKRQTYNSILFSLSVTESTVGLTTERSPFANQYLLPSRFLPEWHNPACHITRSPIKNDTRYVVTRNGITQWMGGGGHSLGLLWVHKWSRIGFSLGKSFASKDWCPSETTQQVLYASLWQLKISRKMIRGFSSKRRGHIVCWWAGVCPQGKEKECVRSWSFPWLQSMTRALVKENKWGQGQCHCCALPSPLSLWWVLSCPLTLNHHHLFSPMCPLLFCLPPCKTSNKETVSAVITTL